MKQYILKDSHSVGGKILPAGSQVELTEKQANAFRDKVMPIAPPAPAVVAEEPVADSPPVEPPPAPKGKAGPPSK